VSLGGFDPPPLGLLVCIHYTTMGGFDPPPLICQYATTHCNDVFW